MQLVEYERFVLETATTREDGYAGCGLSGESGEVFAEVVKLLEAASKANEQYKKIIRGKDKTNELRSELGDVFWYATRIAIRNGLCLEEILDDNVAKLLDRKKNGKKTG